VYARDRFDKHWHLDPDTGCHIWTGGTAWGYGVFWCEGSTRRAHRWIVQFERGPIPDGMTVDHLCRNRACVNIDHLEVVTPKENARRRSNSDTERPCIHGHDLSELVVTVYDGIAKRYCRACYRERATARRRAAGVPTMDERRLINRNVCVNGHPIASRNDLYIQADGRTRCKRCVIEGNRRSAERQHVKSSVSTVAT
jgi:hypothetical protein